jgi:hypothetical protein
MVTKNSNQLITQNDLFGQNCGAKNLGILLRILQNVIEKSFINWRVLSLVKINTRLSETPCIPYTLYTANLKFRAKKIFLFFFLCNVLDLK